jgi:hypothetical protein
VTTALSNTSFTNLTAGDFANTGELSKLSRDGLKALEAEQARAHRCLLAQMNHADDTECQLGIDICWTPDDPQYMAALRYLNNRTFIRVVEHLEGLVVQRLFELSKANLASTGEFEAYISVINSS